MQLVLVANTMESPGFGDFLLAAAHSYPNASFALCGDLLNVFPEPGEDFSASIFCELYGDAMLEELHQLHLHHFSGAATSKLIEPLREIFCTGGRTFLQGRALASQRYGRVFGEIRAILGRQPLYLIPGNMDYPQLTALFAAACPNIHCLDARTVEAEGLVIGGVGGIPSTAQPFGKVAQISPYEMTYAAYESQLAKVWGCDVLLTHLAPEECPALAAFVRESPVRLLLCRAPFDFRRSDDCRGLSQIARLDNKMVVKIRPFEYPENATFVVELAPGDSAPQISIFGWCAPEARLEHAVSGRVTRADL